MLQNRLFRISFGAVCLLVLSFVVAAGTLGGAGYVLPYLQGRRLLVAPPFLRINDAEDRVIIPVVLTNIDTQSITVISANSSCSCATVEQLPLTIPGRKSITLRIAYRPSKVATNRSVSLVLITDSQDEPQVPLLLLRTP